VVARFYLPTLVILFFLSQQAGLAADEVFDKPLFLMVFDKTCHAWCAKLRPIVKELQQEYGDRVDFAELDITQEVLPESKKIAKQLGILKLVPDFGDQVPSVAMCAKERIHLIKELSGPKPKAAYKDLIELALHKQ
jgi:thiol-disulfide isomerase/thioredoxin